MRIHYWRDLPTAAEREPEPEAILHLDAHLLVADKPHGMAVTPSGKHLRQTLLARLRRRPELAHVAEQLAPLHRIDRDTAGLVLFSVNLATRGAYQALFRAQAMHKTYEAIAPFNPELPLPPERRSRIVPAGHFMQMQEVDGPANAHTRIELLDLLGGVGAPPAAEARGDRSAAMLARYALSPSTGKRHQLRVHMNALGLPILHDGIYPTLLPEGAVDSLAPLQLLARRIAFTDPVTGMARMFESRRLLLN
jgi:tRNA pseudouridine32 synthase/23S rRNA pseudouridine746 synthase